MFKNYLKIAFRNLVKHKDYSFINITGLAIGIAVCILIFLFIRNELTFDAFHENAERIFRVNSVFNIDGRVHQQALTPMPFAPAIKQEFPEVESAVRFLRINSVVRYQERKFNEQVTYADSDILRMFTFPLLAGNKEYALAEKNAVVISEDIAVKYFGDTSPLGQIISISVGDGVENFIVKGIAKRPPTNSSIRFDILIPFEKLRDFVPESVFNNWGNFSMRTFVQLIEFSKAGDVNIKLPVFISKYVENSRAQYRLQGLRDIHLGHDVQEGMAKTSQILYSYVLATIALLILVIASINSVNISVAHSSVRFKEIGIRKVLGAARHQLVKQFMGESLVISAIAFVTGLMLAEFSLPLLGTLTERPLSFGLGDNWLSAVGLLVFILMVGLLSGVYPAMFLSRRRPVEVLKGKQKIGKTNILTRSLIVFQFIVSVFLMIATGVIMRQLDFMKNKNLGFASENVLVLPVSGGGEGEKLAIFQNEVRQYGGILKIAGANSYPGGGYGGTNVKSGERSYDVNIARVDYDFLDFFDMRLKNGRNFSERIISDTKHAVIINETLFRKLGWESIERKELTMDWGGLKNVAVIGVVEDFHFTSLHEEIEPIVFYVNPEVEIEYIFIKLKPYDMAGAIATLKNKWQTILPDVPFEYFFLDKQLKELYQTEERWSAIFEYSSGFAIVIACFGLFGLSALVISKRTKEIAIRKTVGASVTIIVKMLTSEFNRLVLIANIVTWPMAYYAMNRWLQDFAYRVEIGWWTFIATGLLTALVALLSVSFQAIKAALVNPVEGLRYE